MNYGIRAAAIALYSYLRHTDCSFAENSQPQLRKTCVSVELLFASMASYLPIDYAQELPDGVSHTFGLFDSCPSPDLPMRDLSDPAIANLYRYQPAYAVLVTVVYPCFCAVGLAANGAFLISVFRVRYMRTITNIYLSNLAVADIWFLLTGKVPRPNSRSCLAENVALRILLLSKNCQGTS